MSLMSPSLTYGLPKHFNINMVFNNTKMAKANNMSHWMVWVARKDGQCLNRIVPKPSPLNYSP